MHSQSLLDQNLPVAGTASCLNCLTSVGFVVVCSPLSLSCQLLAAHSDQTIINSNVTIGLENLLNRAKVIIYSEEAFSLTVYGTFGEARGEEREERTGKPRRGESRRGEVSGWMIMSDSIY